MHKNLDGKWALVTGASSGLGAEFARQLAAQRLNLVITARRKDRLEALATEITTAHPAVKVEVVPADLGTAEGPKALFDATEGAGRPIEVLINNAGFGTHDRFSDIPWERSLQQLQLNIVALTELTWRFLEAMKARGAGFICNVASIGAWMPVADYATYAASKAFVRNFTEAVAFEERGLGVTLSCLCPGPTRTEFMDVAGHAMTGMEEKLLMSAEACVRVGLRGLWRGKPVVVPGVSNTLMVWSPRLISRRLLTWMTAKLMAKKR